ncbi:MAG: PqqD family protein [Cyanobacteria bacterium P01_A01_bin.84]
MNTKYIKDKIFEDSIVVASKEQISSDLGEESVILNLKSSEYHGLNEVGARVWNLIQQPKNVGDIKAILLEEYEVEPQRCLEDLKTLLHELVKVGLVEIINGKTA